MHAGTLDPDSSADESGASIRKARLVYCLHAALVHVGVDGWSSITLGLLASNLQYHRYWRLLVKKAYAFITEISFSTTLIGNHMHFHFRAALKLVTVVSVEILSKTELVS